jgi:predicted metal-dependent phosphoesterase TrpH
MIDLHLHSAYSLDGEIDPKDLLNQCHMRGLKIIAITDHNDCRAYSDISNMAKEKGMTLLSGIEIDCLCGDLPLHLLAYGIDVDYPEIQKLCQRQFRLELEASQKRIEAINRYGFDLSLDDFSHLQNEVITPEDIGEVLLRSTSFLRHPQLLPYRKDGLRGDNPLVNFYWDFYSKDKPCYIPMEYPSVNEVIKLIQGAGGISILAHPGVTFKGHAHDINGLIDLGIDGIEAFSTYHSHDQTMSYLEMAQEKDLLITAGSDFHGYIKPQVHFGKIPLWDKEEILYASVDRMLEALSIK